MLIHISYNAQPKAPRLHTWTMRAREREIHRYRKSGEIESITQDRTGGHQAACMYSIGMYRICHCVCAYISILYRSIEAE